jgi:uncharacterized protein
MGSFMKNNSVYSTKEEIALAVIRKKLKDGTELPIGKKDVPAEFHRDGACFVTVFVNSQLRGCIGSPEAYEPLYKNIVRNAVASITDDYRFQTVTYADIQNITVEVSILTPLTQYIPQSVDTLLAKLTEEKPGLVLEKDRHRALFLPQVWKSLPDPEDFLTQLCLKAGLSPTEWKAEGMRYWTFTLEKRPKLVR